MTDAEAQLARAMVQMGHDALLPATEATSRSVWVDDEARVPAPGYYVRERIPLTHRFLRDGKTFIFEFRRGRSVYRIRASCESTADENANYVRNVFRKILSWIDDGLVTWDQGFSGFLHETPGNEWWRVLRLPPDATLDEIETAYRRCAFAAHPDRGGSHDAFLSVNAAYDAALASR